MSTHDLKSWPVNFRRLARGFHAEVRRNDRNFALGDFVHVTEFEPTAATLTGRTLDFRILDVWPVQPAQDHVLVTYGLIEVQPEVLPPPPAPRPLEVPQLELFAKLVDVSRVMQTVEDDRGERHQIFGSGMAGGIVRAGHAGTLKIYAGGMKTFTVSECVHDFSQGLNCTKCQMPISMA